MLQSLRKIATSRIAAVILFAPLVISFAVWGIADIFRGGSDTTAFTVGSVGLQLVMGLGSALLLNRAFAGSTVVRSLFVLPYLVPSIVVALVFQWLLSPEYGVVNQILMQAGAVSRPVNFFGGAVSRPEMVRPSKLFQRTIFCSAKPEVSTPGAARAFVHCWTLPSRSSE